MNYQEEYQKRLAAPEEIARQVQSGWVCCADIATAIPTALVNALGYRAMDGKLKDVTLHTMLDLVPLSALSEAASSGITPVSWFSGGGLRTAANEGRGDIMPCHYRDMPGLFRDYIDIDALFLAVSPMDKHGYFTAGITGSNTDQLLRKANRIYLEVNPHMPRVPSAPIVHISQVEGLCEFETSLPVATPAVIDTVSQAIGGLIAEQVSDGATIQLGIGAIPDAVGMALKDKHDLGIHTELFTDSMVELIQCGAVTNQCKPLYTGKSVAAFAYGSQRIYDYIDDNPAFQLLPVNEVNDPYTIAQLPNFVSVNSALEVDFFGQVCAESMGTRHVSGSGGQADYVRGAVQSKGGQSFIAFASTAKDETISRICPTLAPGAIVTTSKNDVDYIVTEYGIAKLRGKTLSQRTKALIAIAHPKFRDELTHQAKQRNIII